MMGLVAKVALALGVDGVAKWVIRALATLIVVGLLVVLKHRILILIDLLHSRNLAEEFVGVWRDEQLSSGIETPVLELGECYLADLEFHPRDLVCLCFDIGLLQPKLRLALLDLLSNLRVLLVDRT